MIGKITGRIDTRGPDHVLIDVNGVGYIVYCSERVLGALPTQGAMVSLYTDLLVREDNLQLFGFLSLLEKEWHKLLTSVQGVGAKAALAISGTLGVDGVSRAITLGDAAAIKAAPGVGPKLAQRVVSELQDKAAKVIAMGAQDMVAEIGDDAVIETPTQTPKAAPALSKSAKGQADALSALVNLGYGQMDAAQAVTEAADEAESGESADIIRLALKRLADR